MSKISPDLKEVYFPLQFNGKNANTSKKENIFILLCKYNFCENRKNESH